MKKYISLAHASNLISNVASYNTTMIRSMHWHDEKAFTWIIQSSAAHVRQRVKPTCTDILTGQRDSSQQRGHERLHVCASENYSVTQIMND